MTEVTPGRTAALAWLKRSFQLGVVSSLPRDEEGEVIWDLAGPMMQRELPTVKFAVIYLTALDEQSAEILAMRVLNEWHGLEPGTGLEDMGPDDLKPDTHDVVAGRFLRVIDKDDPGPADLTCDACGASWGAGRLLPGSPCPVCQDVVEVTVNATTKGDDPDPGTDDALQASNTRRLIARIKARTDRAELEMARRFPPAPGVSDTRHDLRERAAQAGATERLGDIGPVDLKPEESEPSADDVLRAYLSDLRGLVARIKACTAWADWDDEEIRAEVEGWEDLAGGLRRALGDDPPKDESRVQRRFFPWWPEVWSAIDQRILRPSTGGEIDRRLRNAWFMMRMRGLEAAWWTLYQRADVSDRTRAGYEPSGRAGER